ncbi:MAG: LysM domain-containing protein [Bacillota bacterium]|nr:LysM domain-containing protein [Bacillota bacterium]
MEDSRQLPPPPPCDGQLYTVQPGETMSALAERFDVSFDALVAANPQVTNPARLLVGQVLCIPRVAPPYLPLHPPMPPGLPGERRRRP